MQTMTQSYRSLSLIIDVHGDKLLYAATVAAALALGAGVGTLFTPGP
ncbi:MAG: hypothetical protein V2I65_09900 [Paracoccaceae bacterium]|jgi:hypothetical protein|nr:hypothetical protein [Paracoccaceae bacterium]